MEVIDFPPRKKAPFAAIAHSVRGGEFGLPDASQIASVQGRTMECHTTGGSRW
jgi:hypothetical protein